MGKNIETVEQYLAALPAERREAIQAVRDVILKNLDKDYAEGIQYGMIGYFVPHRVYPPGYRCDPKQPLPFANLASQKNHMSLYLTCVYSNPELQAWFRSEWAKTGKKLDMGKACVRFKKLDDLPLELIGRMIARVPVRKLIAIFQRPAGGAENKRASKSRAKATKKTSEKKSPRKAAAKKSRR